MQNLFHQDAPTAAAVKRADRNLIDADLARREDNADLARREDGPSEHEAQHIRSALPFTEGDALSTNTYDVFHTLCKCRDYYYSLLKTQKYAPLLPLRRLPTP